MYIATKDKQPAKREAAVLESMEKFQALNLGPDYDFSKLLDNVVVKYSYQYPDSYQTYAGGEERTGPDGYSYRTSPTYRKCISTGEGKVGVSDLPLNETTVAVLQSLSRNQILREKTASNTERFNELKSAIDPDKPETMTAYTDFLQGVGLTPKDFNNPASDDYEGTIQNVFDRARSKKGKKLSDKIGLLVAAKEIAGYLKVDVLTVRQITSIKNQIKSEIRKALSGEIEEVDLILEGQSDFKSAQKEISKLRRGFTEAEKIATIDPEEKGRKITALVGAQTDKVYSDMMAHRKLVA